MSTLSIIIPAYDQHEVTALHVREIMKSTRLPDEVIVVNDGGADDLKDKLKQFKIKINHIPSDQIFDRLREIGTVSSFSRLLMKFLNLYKSNPTPVTKLKEKSQGKLYSKRYIAFLDIFETIFNDYQTKLGENNEIDFHDMINLATEQVRTNAYNSPHKYILVDEFQDISHNRYRLLNALLRNNEESKLFCVGDDWQSIYRFTGSDLSIMTDFHKYFQPNELMYLTQTFRFPTEIRDVSSKFIMKNKQQYIKELTAINSDSPGVTIVWYENLVSSIKDTLYHIDSLEQETSDIKILGRYNKHFYKELENMRFDFKPVFQTRLDEEPLNVQVDDSTVHSSKGTESDYVVIIGVKSDEYGFPCEIEDDPVLNLVLSEEDGYAFAEERRVFYVAMTRAKKQVIILAERSNVSTFVLEIVRDNPTLLTMGTPPSISYCSVCGKGVMKKGSMNGEIIYLCSRYPACTHVALFCPKCEEGYLYKAPDLLDHYYCSNSGCDFMPPICPWCGEGYLVIRDSNGRFWGCSNFSQKGCRYTQPILM